MDKDISVLVLGAGQEVGRSCVVLHVEDTYVMVDCGMHVGFRDARRFPDFKLLPFHDRLTEMISAVVITHFHLDHCAALPYLTQVCGYKGPVYATHPTRAIMPIMLQDYHKVMTERQGGKEWYTLQDVAMSMRQVIGIDLNAATQVAPGVVITALYAGHVLGAAQVHVNMHGRTILHTGDYNTSADRHLGAAALSRLRPDLLISESTYATTLRDSKKSRERDLLTEVLRAVQGGGKVLIPVMAVGRAQELLILLEEAWRRSGLVGRVPLYFAGATGGRANLLYRAHVNWASQQLRSSGARHAAFAFEHVLTWDPAQMDAKGPAVLFASPGMMNGGVSLEVFKAWAPEPRNLVVLPNFQVAGTVAGKLMSGKVTELPIGNSTVSVRCKVRFLSFSAHTDAAGILQLLTTAAPRAVMFVHGDKLGMEFMAARVHKILGVPCFYPPNGSDWVRVPSPPQPVPVAIRLSQALRAATAALHPQLDSACQHRTKSAAEAKEQDASQKGGNEHCYDLELPPPVNSVIAGGYVVGKLSQGLAVDLQLVAGAEEPLAGLLDQVFTLHMRD